MGSLEHVKKLREEYERALDAAESRRSAYHEAVLELYQGGIPLREIAKELGLSHQRVHQIVSGEPPRRGKLPRAAGGAAGVALILAVATFGALRLAHAPPFARRTSIPSRIVVVPVRDRHGFRPGGAAFRKKREVLVRGTPIGTVSLWVAPDRVSRTAHCSWIQVGRMGLGGSCWGPPLRGLPEVVPAFFRFASARPAGPGGPAYRPMTSARLLIWGRTGVGVDRLALVFRDGTRMDVLLRGGMFLIASRALQTRWHNGARPTRLVAYDTQGRIVDDRPVRLDRAAQF